MGHMLSRVLSRAITAAALGLAAGSSVAQTDYPQRPITLIVPFAAGGPTDVVARIAGDHMSRTLGQPVIIENVGGAGGTTASTRAARAAPDGYTIEMGHMGTHAASVALYPDQLLTQLLMASANGAALNMAHAGVGSVSFTTCLLLNSILGVKPASIPFNGTGPALTALISGQVDYMCDQIVNLVQQVQGGQIKAYAIGTPERSPALPGVPTSKVAGLPEFQAQAWNALFAPKDTPQPILDRLSDALHKALDDEQTRKRLLELGSVLPDQAGRGQQALAALVKSEIARWTPIIKAAGPTN